MYENFEVALKTKINENNEVEINDFTRTNLINGNFYEGLSFYEICCKPREIRDVNKIKFDFKKIDRIIKETLRCNICLQIYQEPVNMKTCLHKFCKKCIEEYNRRIKKECASCRHPIETRRLLREDAKIKEIINCLIPSIEKYNEVEDQIIKNFLPQFCFNDVHRASTSLQNKINMENPDKLQLEMQQGQVNDLDFLGLNESLQKIIGRKKPRDSTTERNMASRYEDIWNRIESCQTSQKGEKLKEIEVRLHCDLMNEDMKKSFNKTKIFTKENITLEYFSKYICFKQELKSNVADKIIFSCYDDMNVKIPLERNLSIKEVIEMTNIKEDIVKLHFSFAK